MNNIIIIGGDKRQTELKNILLSKGCRCTHINSPDKAEEKVNIRKEDVVILPVPVSKDKENIYTLNSCFRLKMNDVFSQIDATNLIFGGGISKAAKAYLDEKNAFCFDYLECDETVIYNAYLTGIGALKLLLEKTDEDVRDKKVLITGFGKVARFTAQSLKRAGCDVYVSARNRLQLTEAECFGYKTIEFDKMCSFLYIFDYVFNTVPENIFTLEDVCHIKGKYFELASAPFGARKEYFAGRENEYVFGGSLPGRYLPYSAAEKLAEITIKQINLRNGGD